MHVRAVAMRSVPALQELYTCALHCNYGRPSTVRRDSLTSINPGLAKGLQRATNSHPSVHRALRPLRPLQGPQGGAISVPNRLPQHSFETNLTLEWTCTIGCGGVAGVCAIIRRWCRHAAHGTNKNGEEYHSSPSCTAPLRKTTSLAAQWCLWRTWPHGTSRRFSP